jgi:hypothetical protein
MGMVFFSRELHDTVFAIYGRTLGVPPEEIPPMVAGASLFDSALVGALAAFRWRASWWPKTKDWIASRTSLFSGGAQGDVDEYCQAAQASGIPVGGLGKAFSQPTGLQGGPALPAE